MSSCSLTRVPSVYSASRFCRLDFENPYLRTKRMLILLGTAGLDALFLCLISLALGTWTRIYWLIGPIMAIQLVLGYSLAVYDRNSDLCARLYGGHIVGYDLRQDVPKFLSYGVFLAEKSPCAEIFGVLVYDTLHAVEVDLIIMYFIFFTPGFAFSYAMVNCPKRVGPLNSTPKIPFLAALVSSFPVCGSMKSSFVTKLTKTYTRSVSQFV